MSYKEPGKVRKAHEKGIQVSEGLHYRRRNRKILSLSRSENSDQCTQVKEKQMRAVLSPFLEPRLQNHTDLDQNPGLTLC